MTSEERDLNFRILDGNPSPEILHALHLIANHRRCIEILRYLVRQNIVGDAFLHEYRFVHNRSGLNFMAEIVKRIDKDVSRRQILAGVHYI